MVVGAVESLKVIVIGGGPAGLFLARLLRLRDPGGEVEVYERNPADATFGFGVVFSERTLSALRQADPPTWQLMRQASVGWTDMELRHGPTTLRYAGHGLTAIARRTLLRILQDQAAQAGARLHFGAEVSAAELRDEAHVVALASGANCADRDGYAERFGTDIETAQGKYIWFGTHAPFTRVTFAFASTEHGTFAAHAYPYEDGASTFIVTTDRAAWQAAGLDAATRTCQGPGESDHYSQKLMADVFRDLLGGGPLLVNNTKWTSFRVVRNRTWSYRNLVLLGDAAHTAHPSIGSGTKMAMEDSIALAAALSEADTVPGALGGYERARRPVIERTQRMAAPSMRWWETFGRRMRLEPRQLGFNYLTRTNAITYAGLRRRDPESIADLESWFGGSAGGALGTPVRLAGAVLRNRIAVEADTPEALACYAGAGAGLVFADWRGPGAITGTRAAWRTAAGQARSAGAVVAALLDPDDPAGLALARTAGLPLVAVTRPGRALPPAILRLTVPAESAWTPAADGWLARLRDTGVVGIHLDNGIPVTSPAHWYHLLGYADRVRTEVGLPVVVDGPDGWALDGPVEPDADDWRTRMHVALLSGRVDLVATWPLPRTVRRSA